MSGSKAVIVAPTTCPDCNGGAVRPMCKPGRTRRARGGDRMPIPDDLPIPTCERCGAEWMDYPTAKALSALDKPAPTDPPLEAWDWSDVP